MLFAVEFYMRLGAGIVEYCLIGDLTPYWVCIEDRKYITFM
jgi:hypothetical protein